MPLFRDNNFLERIWEHMKTGLTKSQKTTEIYFDESSPIIFVRTHNTDLRTRLRAYSEEHPRQGQMIDDDERGGYSFEIEKGRLWFRLTAPYSEERRKKARENVKGNALKPRK